ncbi:poly-beta-1,6-N-acetyl-D-glucosamine N-deacetylase PgaB [Burkholderia singularis]|uniref:Biofilm PGA synthesis deacetylase PgaB (EC 3.-) n=1 Tax=Burkholderia singularis TaxID=1503053 RepID=A0A238H6L8_9BURK|nr:poly-beta-1,6-N-acetyl-D-glucosamine N-deacetylase PgaB [Burkholderia singularis]SMG00830.1 Biofilm PGA synthesis deacetylase PgaB (EC 3.-) [Burkholderia singularis]
MRRLLSLILLLGLAASAARAADRLDALSGALRTRAAPPPLIVLTYHDVLDDVRDAPRKDEIPVSTDHLIAHFEWLRANGFHMVSLDDVLAAGRGERPLPDKAVLLSFDDGLASAYSRVYPLLRAYRYPALFALEGSWIDLPPGKTFDYNGKSCGRECFVTWSQVREMQASGLIEFASHTYDLHRGIVGNPQRNLLPAAVHLLYDPARGYETPGAYRERIRADLARSADEIARETGRRPRAIVWPYGDYNQIAEEEAARLGMTVSLSLDDARAQLKPGVTVPRLLIAGNMGVDGLATLIYEQRKVQPQRIVQVDLDYVYDPDPAQQEQNLSALLERIKRMKPSQVWLQAYADPDGDGVADALYFPNRHLPMRADLFSRVAWQLSTRCNVQVYAWMPVLALRLAHAQHLPTLGRPGDPNDRDHYRLAPWSPDVRRMIGDVYEDLAMHAFFDGLLFSDDAYLRDTDSLGPLAGSTPAQRTQYLIDFTKELTARASRWRSPLKTARNLYARPVLEPRAEAWFAQSLPAFNAAYDYTALMAMPQLDGEPTADSWLRRLVDAVAAHPGGLERTLFELAAVDWRHGHQPVPAAALGARMRVLQEQGARHVGYYPDDFIRNQPPLEAIRPFVSSAEHPYPER